jgi:DNA-binding winged helix-turn-helix (wHTH) protein
MAKKNKILILDFDELQANALADFLNSLGDFEPLIETSNEVKTKDQEFLSKFMVIFQSLPSQNEIDEAKISASLLIALNKDTKPKYNHQNILRPPFRLKQLENILRNIIRQKEQNSFENLVIGETQYSQAKRALINSSGFELKLTDKELEILTYLNDARPNCVPREELLREVWQYSDGVSTHTLETHIYRLRQKLITILGDTEVLITEEGGYKLIN